MKIKIYYKDTDCGGVVYYANYLIYFEHARTEWMENRGVSISGLQEKGVLFVVKHANINYKTPACYGEIIDVSVTANVGGASIDFCYEIKESVTKRLIVNGFTQLVCINPQLRPMRIPKEVLSKLQLA